MTREIAGFLRFLDRERNASPHTVRAYAADLEQFQAHLQSEMGRPGTLADVDHLVIRGFLAHLHRSGIKKVSAARKLATLRTFFRYLCREGVIERNPARALLSPRMERRIPAHVEEGEIAALIEVPGATGSARRASRRERSVPCCLYPEL